MFCRNCGMELREGAKFCPECGTLVDVDQESTPTPPEATAETTPTEPAVATAAVTPSEPAPAPTPEPTKTPWHQTKAGRIVIGACAVFVFAYGIYSIVTAFKPKAEPAPQATSSQTASGFTPSSGAVSSASSTTDTSSTSGTSSATSADVSTPTSSILPFDANGGAGTMDPLQVFVDQPTTIPECSYTREGYTFVGWGTSPEGSYYGLMQPGTYNDIILPGSTPAPTLPTLFARWYATTGVVETSVTRLNELQQGNFATLGQSGYGVLVVKNDTDKVVHLVCDFEWKDASGGQVGKSHAEAYAVAPGVSASIADKDATGKAVSATYYLTCKLEDPFIVPFGEDNLAVNVTAQDEDVVTYHITNVGDVDVTINSVRTIGTNAFGAPVVGDAFAAADLKPGDSLDATIERSLFYDYSNEFEFVPPIYSMERVTYLNGYVTVPHDGTGPNDA